jgi:hypothetical protein
MKLGVEQPQSLMIYAILVPDENCKPRPFRTLYFGHGAAPAESHEKYREWVHRARNRTLYVSVYPAANATCQERCELVKLLTDAYRPMCSRYW